MGCRTKQSSQKEAIQKAEKHLNKCSTSLAFGEMQIKTTWRFPLTMAKINKTNGRTFTPVRLGEGMRGMEGWGVRGCGGGVKSPLIYHYRECKTFTASVKINVTVLRKSESRSISRSSYTPLRYIYPMDSIFCCIDTCLSRFTC